MDASRGCQPAQEGIGPVLENQLFRRWGTSPDTRGYATLDGIREFAATEQTVNPLAAWDETPPRTGPRAEAASF